MNAAPASKCCSRSCSLSDRGRRAWQRRPRRVAERTRIVEIAWPASSGAAPQILWTENESALPAPPPAVPTVDLSPILAKLAAIDAKVDQLARDEDEFHARVHDAWEKTGAVFLKYIAPALAAFFGGKAIQ